MDETAMNRLNDVTFVIPLRVDSPERSRNLDILTDFITLHFDSRILVIEADSRQRYFIRNNHHNLHYLFIEDDRHVFHRTRYMNILNATVDTPVIAGWDTDVVLAPQQIVDTVMQVRCGNAVMGLPYDGIMFNTTDELTRRYQDTLDYRILIKNTNSLRPMYGNSSVGGGFIVDTEKYLRAGGENENFSGWGPEDCERVKRMEILYPQLIYRARGGMYHLWHPRYLNSWYADKQYEINSKKEYLKVCGMSRDELRDYINSWPWLERLHKASDSISL